MFSWWELPHKRHRGRAGATAGFTLMEVVVTLGIVGMFVGILGVLPQIMTVSAEAGIETRAAHIAHQIIRDLVPAPSALPPVEVESAGPDGHPPTAVPFGKMVSRVSEGGGDIEMISLREPGAYQAFYDLEGRPVAELDAGASLKAEIVITPQAGRLGFCQVEVSVRSMSAAPTVRVHRFFSKVVFPRKEAPQS